MNKILLSIIALAFAGVMTSTVSAQNGPLVRYIGKTGEDAGVAISTDDAEQENDEMDALDDDDIDAGWEGEDGDANILTAGMRFKAIFLPQGAAIDSAFIYVTSHEAKAADDVANLTIYAEAADNASTFTLDALITDRTSTTATVSWVVDEEWGLWTEHRTPDVGAIVQEVVGRAGWVSGNAIAFVFAGEDQGPSAVENAREWESFENIADPEDGGDGQNHPERIPRIEIYSAAVSGINPVVFGELSVYPNPANGEFSVELVSPKPASLRFFNPAGQVVREIAIAGQEKVTVATEGLSAGIYMLEVVQDNKRFTEKVVIE